jgi:integrase
MWLGWMHEGCHVTTLQGVDVMPVLKRCGCSKQNWSKCSHSWTARWWDSDGKQHEQGFELNKKAAEAHLAQVRADKLNRRKNYGEPTAPVSFEEYALDWLAHKVNHRAPNTVNSHRQQLKLHLLPELGKRQLADVAGDRDKVSKLLNALSAGNQRPAYSTLRAILSEAERDGKVEVNRCRGIALEPRPPQKKVEVPTHEQMTALAKGMGDLAAIVWVMRGTGCRPGEALALEKADFVNGHLRVQRQQTRAGEAEPLKARKVDDYRDTPCPTFVRELIEKMPDGRLFNVSTRDFNARFRKAADAAGLVNFRPHDMRHTFVSIALDAGVPITNVSRWIGHKDINTTFSIYSHLVPNSFDLAREALDNEYADWSKN